MSLKEQGENNRLVTLLTPKGIIYATLYGGAKSKMRSLVQQFNSGTIWLYEDNIKKSTKINDFDVKNSHLTIRENLFKLWAANLAIELIIKTHCAGEEENSFILLNALLDGMDLCNEENARLGFLRFLWRYLRLLGVQPSVKECAVCSKSFSKMECDEERIANYIELFNGFVCKDCSYAIEEKNILPYEIDLEGLEYLSAINDLSPKQVRLMTLKKTSAYSIKHILYQLIEKAAGCKLHSLESGHSIL